MQWSDVTKPPTEKTLRQFAGLCLLFFGGLGAWRMWRHAADAQAIALVTVGAVVGLAGLVRPSSIRLVFTGWMMAAFPIGWAVSRVALGMLFYGMFTPVAAAFRLSGRDALHRRRQAKPSYWSAKPQPADSASYLRQS
jgi:TRAP-type C4-dicarboxylate transport system permease small subunit